MMSFKHAAPKFFQRLRLNSDWRRASTYCCIHNTLPLRAHAWAIENPSGWRIFGSLEAWYHLIVSWWDFTMVLPTKFYLFSRLSWKVSHKLTFQAKFTIHLQDIDCEHSQSWQVPMHSLPNPTLLSSLSWNDKGHVTKTYNGLYR